MRFAVMADIHGNLPALEAVLEDMQQYAVDGVIVAGDIIGGPHVVETIQIIQSLNGWTIRGNNEEYFRKYQDGTAPEGWQISRQWAPMRWVYRQLNDAMFGYLFSLPEQVTVVSDGATPLRVVHGSPRSQSETLFPETKPEAFHQALADIAESVMICGHTHRPWQHLLNGKFALNPGAVGGPLNGHVGTQYAVITWHNGRWNAELRAISYDIAHIRKAYQESGFLEEGGAFVKSWLYTLETGHDVTIEFLKYAYGVAEEAGYAGCETVPDDAWERAAETFDWSRYR
jgi:predicted phosphodiesterase